MVDQTEYQDLWKEQQLNFLQSWQWGELREGLGNWHTERYVLAGVPITVLLRRLPIFGQTLAYIPRLQVKSDVQLTQIISQLRVLPYQLVIIDPAWKVNQYPIPTDIQRAKQIQPNYTNQLNLEGKTADSILQEMDGKYRRNINKSLRQDVKVDILNFETATSDKISQFYKVMQEVARNTDFVLLQESYFQKMWEKFGRQGYARLYLARLGSDYVGGYLVIFDELGAHELYGGVTLQGRDVEAGYALKWQSIVDALELGKKYYDHWGVAKFSIDADNNVIYDSGDPLYNISKFKNGFGGENIEFEHQLLIANSTASYYYYQLLDLTKKVILKFKKLLK